MSDLRILAAAFHAGAETIRNMKDPEILDASGALIPVNPMAAISRSISSDVLQTIGNIYLGLAMNDGEELPDTRETRQ